MISAACDSAGDLLNGCEEEPCCCAFDGPFEVFGEAAVAVEPREGALDDPSARASAAVLAGLISALAG